MVRSIAITLAAVAAIEAGSTFSSPALARGMGGMGHTGIAGLGVPSRSGIAFAFRHRFFGPRFAFTGAPFAAC